MRLRFSTRLILGVILIEAVMLTTLVWNSVRLIRSSHEAQLLQNVEAQTRLLAASLQPGLASNDRALLADALSLLEGNPGIHYVLVEDREGQPMARLGDFHGHERPRPDTSYSSAESDGVYDVVRPIVLFGQPLGTLRIGYDIGYVQELIDTTRRQNSLIAAAELILSIVLTIALGLYLTRNLRKLELGAEALGREELDHRIDVPPDDEVGAVASAFNRLADHLQRTRRILRDEHAALAREKQRMETLLNNIKAVIVEADPQTMQFHFVSQEAETLLGYAVDDWLQPDFWRQRLHPDDLDWVLHTLQEQARLPGEYTLDYRLQHRRGDYVWVRSLYTIEQRQEGYLARGLFIDISEQKTTEERIVFLANHDPLTNLYNRRRFQEQLERQIAYARRFKIESALLFIDLDQFKYINDTLGHQAGDQCLMAVARVFRHALREIDIIGRMGGDEFGVILPNVDAEGAMHVAQNL
ncbi:MAG TPA: diguanylate cyclase, partial [Gammaproteobacteria bacterium]|nr:diguanylate cyclase [Gammaproteobacteria bacterium]